MRVFLAGEGKAELGDWAGHPSYRHDPPEVGLLEILLRRVRPDGWAIAGSICWKNLPEDRRMLPRSYRAHQRMPAEVGNVLGLVLRARDAGCDAVMFTRDRDRDLERERNVIEGIARAREVVLDRPKIVGGMAIEAIESWIASLQGTKNAESSSAPNSLLADSTLASKRDIARRADFAKLPADARSLRSWLSAAAVVFGADPAVILGMVTT